MLVSKNPEKWSFRKSKRRLQRGLGMLLSKNLGKKTWQRLLLVGTTRRNAHPETIRGKGRGMGEAP